ncbi:coagulation factor 5/8 type-like [Leucobacter sp. 7(1)]|uniref:class I SAM-dependent methyltransferase n=1 Tax=Leucobacter sp. 7(1) TaxID=1255613 RepID=UPI00097E8858|nr:methyltransferase domain-containing protein [Leucobacter sp. 7(1)]SJN12966.1 coagulation factor 5/8 type-like [Leucobacter sp. 7(1)]
MQPFVTPSALALPSLPPGTVSIDLRFDGQRVWSIDVRQHAKDSLRFPWPEALLPYLLGRTRVSVHDSATGTELGAAEVEFDDAPARVSVVDVSGNPLVVNKWGRLGTALEAMGAVAQRRIIDRASAIIEELSQLGLRPFIVGGTLLGSIRTGSLLPHDDDADIAYLSEFTHPADVAHEGFRVGARLADAGYEIRRHSATHLQLLFRNELGEILHYIDVFAAFFSTDGMINQPFHVRGEMRRDQLLPFTQVTLDGTEFPAPADADHWLTINYDANWRTPIPGYVLETPRTTKRRFDNWFGSFNLHREYWDEHFANLDATEPAGRAWSLGSDWILDGQHHLHAPQLIDLGCGSGTMTHALARASSARRVIGLDYCDRALALAAESSPPSSTYGDVEFHHANLYRLTSLSAPRDAGITGAFDIVANHVLEQIGDHGREQAWRLIRMALRSGGNARFTFHAHHAADVRFEDPTGWHLVPRALEEEAARFGMSLSFATLARTSGTVPGRRPTGAVVSLTDSAHVLDRPTRSSRRSTP